MKSCRVVPCSMILKLIEFPYSDIIHAIYEATDHNDTFEVHNAHGYGDKAEAEADIYHMRHCLDYLWQHIICTMDMRLGNLTTMAKEVN